MGEGGPAFAEDYREWRPADIDGRVGPQSPGSPPAISAHRLLSNGVSTALVQRSGEIDWWCAPEMDSTPVLWSLLDPQGAAARWVGARYVRCGGRPAGPVTTTVLRSSTGQATCRDGLLDHDGGALLVRLVRGDDTDLDLEHELAVGGFDRPWGAWSGGTAELTGVVVTVTATGPVPVHTDGHHLRHRLRGERGTWVALVIGAGATLGAGVEELGVEELGVEELGVEELAERMDEAEHRFAGHVGSARLPRHHPERAADALAVLRACTYRPSGAVVASPTTSLPEAPGHGRQFDYRYTWLRDASLAVSVAALLGRRNDTERYLGFVNSATTGRKLPTGPLTDIRGGAVPAEREVQSVRGWADSRPVRVGNQAAGHVQYDALGLLVEGVSVYLQTGGNLDADTWSMVQAVADHLAGEEDGTVPLSNGMWELREARPLVGGDLGRWLALDRAVWIARMRHPLRRRRHWKRARDATRSRIVAALQAGGGLPQSYGEQPSPTDASALMAPIFGTVKGRSARRLVDATIAHLDAWPHLYRYLPTPDDGFGGREATFVPMSWWAVAALAAVGRVDDARRRADALCAELPRLLAEEFDAEGGTSLGNVPLVWSHMAAARALYILDAAALRRRYGATGLTIWRLARYLRLRYGEASR